MTRLSDVQRFYGLLEKLEDCLGGPRTLRDSNGRLRWPDRGVYFFFENGEHRIESGTGPRVVRVGTHALKAGSKTSLWNRLSQHQGTLKGGGGNHRGSIFRLIVGAALIRRDGLDCPSWGVASHPTQAAARLGIERNELLALGQPIEERVSKHIRDMPFLWVDVEDDAGPASHRGTIETNAIGLLSKFPRPPVDAASTAWLGQYSDRDLVRRSGLWNNNHVQDAYEPGFLDLLEETIAKTAERF